MTVQAALTALVVNTLPAKDPPQVPLTAGANPGGDVIVKLVVPPGSTATGVFGMMAPPTATLGVTLNVPMMVTL